MCTNKQMSKKDKENIVITTFLQECIVGHLLGDGFISKTRGKNTNARFGFSQSGKKKIYFNKVFTNFKAMCTANAKVYEKAFKTNNTNLTSLNFWTIRLPCLNIYYDIFYINGVLIIF